MKANRAALKVSLFIKVVKGASQLLLPVFGGLSLVDARSIVGGIPSEGDIQRLQEGIHACQQTLRLACSCSPAGLTVVDNDAICQIGCHDEVMLYYERSLLGVHDEPLDDLQGKPS